MSGPTISIPDWNGETQALVLAEPALPSALLAQWQSDPAGSGFRHQQAANAVGIFDELDASDQGAVLSGFGGLPEAAQTVILGELSLGSPGTVRSADEATVDDLTQTDEGEILAAHWRGRTARNWGIVRTRYNRIIGLMSADDQQAARAWFDALPSRAKIAALIALAE